MTIMIVTLSLHDALPILLHEVGVARAELLEKSPETARMIAAHHSSPEDAARDFARIKPKLAVYTHYTRPRRDDVPEVTIPEDRKSTRLNSSHRTISYAVF